MSSIGIPSNAGDGKHIVSSFITDTNGNSLLSFNEIHSINTFSVTGSVAAPAPAPAPAPTPTPDPVIGVTFTNTGVYILRKPLMQGHLSLSIMDLNLQKQLLPTFD